MNNTFKHSSCALGMTRLDSLMAVYQIAVAALDTNAISGDVKSGAAGRCHKTNG